MNKYEIVNIGLWIVFALLLIMFAVAWLYEQIYIMIGLVIILAIELIPIAIVENRVKNEVSY